MRSVGAKLELTVREEAKAMSKLAVGLILMEIASWMGCASGPEADGSRSGAAAASAQDATLLLEQGWQEYGFQSFVRAQRMFAATGEVSIA